MRMQEMKTELTTQARPSHRSPVHRVSCFEGEHQMARACLCRAVPEFRQRKLADPRCGISDSRYLLDIACAGQRPGKWPTGVAIEPEENVYMLTRLVN